tara:strand:+ start:95 stop:685 length:591 start_codon:yes stop_codon:yes gene_type:complete
VNFKIFEIIETKQFQFVQIYKNANLSVYECIKSCYKSEEVILGNLLSNKIRFCVIRDPYERFLSGLRYDLLTHNTDIKDIDIKKLFTTNEINILNFRRGNIKHSISQIPYLMNTKITHYVDMKDLNLFLKMHFGKSEHINKFPEKYKDSKFYNVEEYLDKNEIMKYLHLDYYIYNHIKNSSFLWEWQHGKIFDVKT